MPTIVSYATPTGPQFGLLIDRVIHECRGDPYSDEPLAPGRALMPLERAQLLPPAQPSKIVCVGRNYASHAAEHAAEVPQEPLLFFKPPSALIGPGMVIEFPDNIGRVDHEAELAVIMKKRARHVRREEALSCVLGYTCANDVSARTLQKKDGQWSRSKGLDTFCPLGPWISTDLNPLDVLVRTRVNGELRQEDRTSNMVFNVPFLIVYISQFMTLQPGDVILTGTPAGVSELHDGDTVRIEIEGIGALENRVKVVAGTPSPL
jgi:2-keto-4-pentenoate hydratase/2-oxohepta-3-ene-1,7-dioic acid hydratase in catechol pathway